MAIIWVKETSVTTQQWQNYLYVKLQTCQKMQNSSVAPVRDLSTVLQLVISAGSNSGALYQKLYGQSRSATDGGRVCRPKHVELI